MILRDKINYLDIILILSLLLSGSFFEYTSCLLSVMLSVYLFVSILKSRYLSLKINLFSISVFSICIMYAISSLWAIDSGMAVIGFFKFLPLMLYMISLWQSERKTEFQNILPFVSSTMVVVSIIAMYIPMISNSFSVAGRLSGFFQYPNAFALFLLVCELLLLNKKHFKIVDYLCFLVLIIGILYTGSRTVFVIAILSNLVLLIERFKVLKFNKAFLIIFLILLSSIGVLFLFKRDILTRYLSISFLESTFVGRILYCWDALPTILRHPFGIGYLGYSYIQTEIQTGLYTVRYVHNDFLQLFLDVGWIPALIFIVAIISAFFKKSITFHNKVIIGVICLHSFFDFDLQFIALFLILLILLNTNEGKTFYIKRSICSIAVTVVAIFILNIYMGTHLFLSAFNKNFAAEKLYPFNTENKIAILSMTTDIEIANKFADEILAYNEVSYIPYTIKAKYCYSKGEIIEFINYKRLIFTKNPFNYDEYEDYCRLLIALISKFNEIGDYESADFCKNELIEIKDQLEQNKNLLSDLGKKINDQPNTKLSDEVLYFINRFKEELSGD